MSDTPFINDPRSPFFFDGKWYLYGLYNGDYPDGNGTEWRLWTSTDLENWTQEGTAIPKYTTPYGDPWSGTTVVDVDNTAGFGANAVIALCTMPMDGSVGQSTARWVSTDGGKTFTFDSIVMPNPHVGETGAAQNFRDPSVIWMADSQSWVMTLAENNKISFWTSKNLGDWTYLSGFDCSSLGTLECPTLFPMVVQDANGNSIGTKWILLCSGNGYEGGFTTGAHYWTGEFDGTNFVPDSPLGSWLDGGSDFYAASVFAPENISSTPQKSYYSIAWKDNWDYAQQVTRAGYYGDYTHTRTLTLQQDDGSLKLYNDLIWNGEPFSFSKVFGTQVYDRPLTASTPQTLDYLSGNASVFFAAFSIQDQPWPDEIDIDLQSGAGTPVRLVLSPNSGNVNLQRSQSGFAPSSDAAWISDRNAPLDFRQRVTVFAVIDKDSIEVIFNDGELSMTSLVFPTSTYGVPRISVTNGECNIDHFGVGPRDYTSFLDATSGYSGNTTVSSGVISGGIIESGGNMTIAGTAMASGLVVNSGGVISMVESGQAASTTVSSGGTIQATGGVITGATLVANGGLISVASDVLLSGTITDQGMVSGGTLVSGASLDVTTGSAGGMAVGDGASALVTQGDVRDMIVLSGGVVSAGQDGSYSGKTIVSQGGRLTGGEVCGNLTVCSGGEAAQFQIASGGVVDVASGGAVLNDIYVSDAGVLVMSAGADMSGATVHLANGGHAAIDAAAGGAIVMDGDTNTGLIVTGLSSGGTFATTITLNPSATEGSDGIEIDGVMPSDITGVSCPDADHFVLTLSDGRQITMHIIGVQSEGYSLHKATDGDVLYEVCFLAGSMIRTASRDVPVETLQVGDSVMTWDWKNRASVSRPVVWVGCSHAIVRTDCSDDEAGYPVRILRDAIADGVPSQDLLVTPEHCLFFENKFIPARMMVNNKSIFYDRSFTHYDYFHIETAEHAVIWANDTLTESYLDTGNRWIFSERNAFLRFGSQTAVETWNTKKAADPVLQPSDLVISGFMNHSNSEFQEGLCIC
ncbi:MAG: Hint domain-containing protein [Acetobacter sp.]|uniref:Hint domain-containing protein n=1 Tax=Acetobacter sp. TaxID=440 RepID=UPI0039E8D2C4